MGVSTEIMAPESRLTVEEICLRALELDEAGRTEYLACCDVGTRREVESLLGRCDLCRRAAGIARCPGGSRPGAAAEPAALCPRSRLE
jgi:hypothetical protein